MTARAFCSAGAALTLILLFSPAAQAKTINLGVLSRSIVSSACERAKGVAYGMTDETSEYGCQAARVLIVCLPDATCTGLVSDLTPMTGNSFDTLFSTRPVGQPQRIEPVNARVVPPAQ